MHLKYLKCAPQLFYCTYKKVTIQSMLHVTFSGRLRGCSFEENSGKIDKTNTLRTVNLSSLLLMLDLLLMFDTFIPTQSYHLYFSSLVVLHICAVVECVISVIMTLLLSDPLGSLGIRSCPVEKLEDWYTMFYNPSPNYTTTLHCTQEIVFPL